MDSILIASTDPIRAWSYVCTWRHTLRSNRRHRLELNPIFGSVRSIRFVCLIWTSITKTSHAIAKPVLIIWKLANMCASVYVSDTILHFSLVICKLPVIDCFSAIHFSAASRIYTWKIESNFAYVQHKHDILVCVECQAGKHEIRFSLHLVQHSCASQFIRFIWLGEETRDSVFRLH